MAWASREVLAGFELRTEVKEVRHPKRYIDKRGAAMWARATASLERLRQREALP